MLIDHWTKQLCPIWNLRIVICGDLHTETVTTDILAELEAALPQ